MNSRERMVAKQGYRAFFRSYPKLSNPTDINCEEKHAFFSVQSFETLHCMQTARKCGEMFTKRDYWQSEDKRVVLWCDPIRRECFTAKPTDPALDPDNFVKMLQVSSSDPLDLDRYLDIVDELLSVFAQSPQSIGSKESLELIGELYSLRHPF